jgi:ferredoxin-type protein NapH
LRESENYAEKVSVAGPDRLDCGAFLMSGNLHLPVPAMIISGPVYRGSFSVMTLIFLGAILLSGPAWCSQFCYFGAIDSAVAGEAGRFTGQEQDGTEEHLPPAGNSSCTVAEGIRSRCRDLRWAGIITGVAGLLIIFFFNAQRKKMIHCTVWCPVGTLTVT